MCPSLCDRGCASVTATGYGTATWIWSDGDYGEETQNGVWNESGFENASAYGADDETVSDS